MAKADVLQLVADLGHGLADATRVEDYYLDATIDLARRGVRVDARLITTTSADQAVYPLPDDAYAVLGVFWDDRMLSRITPRGAERLARDWRALRGAPQAWIDDTEDAQAFRLLPVPTVGPTDFSFILGSPWGTDFPRGAVAALHTERRDDWPHEFDLPLALDVLTREFRRPSAHRDPTFAQACEALAGALYGLLATGEVRRG